MSNNVYIALQVMIILFLLASTIMIFKLPGIINNYIRTKPRVSLGPEDVTNTIEIIDKLAGFYLERYIFLNHGHIKSTLYINKTEEEEMKGSICKFVIENMSIDLATSLCMVYNPNGLSEIIFMRVDELVTAYVIRTNALQE